MTGVDGILDPLETIAGRGFSRYDVFRDWVRLMLCALQRDDDPYLEIIDEYDRGRDRDHGERNADLFALAFGELMDAMEEANRDRLGDAFEAFGMQSDRFGQHFTPHNVAAALAEVQVGADADDPDPPVTIADPACGSGRLPIYAARRIDQPTFCFGQDKDELCAQMAALNFCFFNVDGVVIWGDSIRVEKKRAWRTANTPFGGEVREVDPESVPLPEASLEERAADQEPAQVAVASADDGGLDQAELDGWSA